MTKVKHRKYNILRLIKSLIPNSLKQEGKYFLLRLLKTPYSRSNAPLEVLKWLPKGSVITLVDIGASVGNFSKTIMGEYKVEKCILVEPVPSVIPTLEHDFPNKSVFHIINAAIADSNAETDFYLNEDAAFVSSLLKIDHSKFESFNFKKPVATKVKTLTLDHLADKFQLAAIDLIKIDVQGAEHLVLLGGTETLKKTKLVYTEFSFQPLYEQSSTFFDLYKIFAENDFILANLTQGYISSEGELLQGDALFANKKLLNSVR